jgi:predicted nucleic acid-binding protein
MATNTSLEERIGAVEAAISELQKQVVIPHPTNWLQQITGSFKDEPAFEEVLAYGRAIRQGDKSLLESENQGWNIYWIQIIWAFFSVKRGRITATFRHEWLATRHQILPYQLSLFTNKCLAVTPTLIAIAYGTLRERTLNDVVKGYEMMARLVSDFKVLPLVSFDASAAKTFEQLRSRRIQLATMDARIAAIALSHGLILLTRNHRDFGKVAELEIEDWTIWGIRNMGEKRKGFLPNQRLEKPGFWDSFSYKPLILIETRFLNPSP